MTLHKKGWPHLYIKGILHPKIKIYSHSGLIQLKYPASGGPYSIYNKSASNVMYDVP